MIRTVTYDTATHKIVPIRPTMGMVHAALEQNRSRKNTAAIAPFGFELFIFGDAYLAMIAAAPEYQDTCTDGGKCGAGGYCNDCGKEPLKDE